MAIPTQTGRPSRTVRIVSGDVDFVAGARKALLAEGFTVDAFAAWSDLEAAPAGDGVVVLDADRIDGTVARAAATTGRRIILAAADDGELIAGFKRHPFVSAGLAKSGGKAPPELAAIVRGLVSGRPWDVDVCLAPGTVVRRTRLASYHERDAGGEQIQRFVATLPTFADFPGLITTAATEMLMNAFLDAPKKAARPPEPVELAFAADGDRLAIAVQDQFGRLTKTDVVDSLERCHRQGDDQVRSGTGGAGVGLYLMFTHANQLHFVVEPGRTTRVVLVARISKRHAEYSEGERALTFTIGS